MRTSLVALALLVAGCGAPREPAPVSPVTHRTSAYKVDAVELYLFPSRMVEYKYQLEGGATMMYTWTSDAPIYFDMHNVPEGRPITESTRIEDGEGTQKHGLYTAPYTGLHGWYWENKSENPITITLKTAGFYSRAVMISDGEQTPMEIRDPPPPIEP